MSKPQRISFFILFLALPALAADATIEVNAGRRSNQKIPRSIYGVFTEPLGRMVYHGFMALLLDNPSFEDNLWSADNIRRMVDDEPALAQSSRIGLPLPWEPLDLAQGWRYQPIWRDAANSSRSLYIMALPGKETGVRQQVYLPVHRIRRYTGSLWAKYRSGQAALQVSLRKRNRADQVLAQADIKLEGSDWRRYEFALELKDGALAPLEAADFVISLRDEARAQVDQALLYPADHLNGLDPNMVAMARDMKLGQIRFGGNFTSAYYWRDGIGPLDKRITVLNQSWGMPEYNHYGTDEYLDLCRRTGAQPHMCLNLATGSVEDAVEWVKYVNQKWGSGGLLWELGNELWGDFQIGTPTITRLAETTRQFSEAVRRVDPKVRLIATGQDPDHYREWNAEQLKLEPGTFQYLSTHMVLQVGTAIRASVSPDDQAQAVLAVPVALERKLREMKQQVDADDRWRGRAGFAFTEWIFYSTDERVPRQTNVGGAVNVAGMLNSFLRLGDIAPISNMSSLTEDTGIYKRRERVYGSPAYYAFRMYSNADATVVVDTQTDVETYDVTQGVNRFPEIPRVPYLDVVGALNDAGDRLTLFVVNRNIKRDVATRLKLAGFQAQPEARVQTLTAASVYQGNSESRPETVIPTESLTKVASPEFEYAFPRGSVTVIELRRR